MKFSQILPQQRQKLPLKKFEEEKSFKEMVCLYADCIGETIISALGEDLNYSAR